MMSKWAEKIVANELGLGDIDDYPNPVLKKNYRLHFLSSTILDELREFCEEWNMTELALVSFHEDKSSCILIAEQLRIGWGEGGGEEGEGDEFAISEYHLFTREAGEKLIVCDTEYTDLKICIYSQEPSEEGMYLGGWVPGVESDSKLELPNMFVDELVHWVEYESESVGPIIAVRHASLTKDGLICNIGGEIERRGRGGGGGGENLWITLEMVGVVGILWKIKL
jgi:hypothetical protein